MQKRRVAFWVFPPVLLLLAIAFAQRSCSALEHPVKHFPTHREAEAAGAVEPSGWIPLWVPQSAYDIHDQHAVDSSTRCIRLSLPAGGADALKQALVPLTPSDIQSLDAKCRFDPDWWFEGLIEQQPANDNALYAELFRGATESSGSVFVAIDRGAPHVFIWSP